MKGLDAPLLGPGVPGGRVPVAAELVAPMCVTLARVALKGEEAAAGALVLDRNVRST